VLSTVESLLQQIETPPNAALAAMADAPDPVGFVPVEAVCDLIRERRHGSRGHCRRVR